MAIWPRFSGQLQPGPPSASFETAKTVPNSCRRARGSSHSSSSEFPGADYRRRALSTCGPCRLPCTWDEPTLIRADQGQPIMIGSIAHTGRHVTINSPLGGTLSIGTSFRTGSNVVVLSGAKVNMVLGNNVTINSGAVVVQTSIGSDSTVGEGAYLDNSNFPAHTIIPPKAIYVNNKFMGYVAW